MEVGEVREAVTSYIKSNLGFYTSYMPNFSLPERRVVRKADFVGVNADEKEALTMVRDIFGDQVDFTQGYRQRETFIAHLKGVCFLGNTGAVEKNLKIVLESVFDMSRLANSMSFKRVSFLKSRKKEGTYTSVMHLPFARKNIYHWTIDCLPRMYNIRHIPGDGSIYLIMNEDAAPYQFESLKPFLEQDPRLKLVTIKATEKWQIEDYWLPSFVTSNQCGYMPKEYLAYVKETMLQGFGIKPAGGKQNLYISRTLAKRRNLTNEKAVCDLMESRGFKVVQAEKLSYQQQLELFAQARIIVSPHGAGLANMLFATNARVIEIHPRDYVQSHFMMLSKACGHRYCFFLGSGFDDKNNYSLNIDAFDAHLNSCLA